MNRKRQKIIYLVLVLLILLITAIIGGLAMALFHTTVESPPVASQHIPGQLLTNEVAATQAVNEKYIEVAVKEPPPPPPEVIEDTAPKVVPNVCEGYGPQIKGRRAYKHRATYSAAISPNLIHFTVYRDNAAVSDKARKAP